MGCASSMWRQEAEWSGTLYRDGVHPTVEGNKVLAGILASEIMHDLER